VLGSEHPDTATSLNGLAELLQAHGDLAGARPLFERHWQSRRRWSAPSTPIRQEASTISPISFRLSATLAGRGHYSNARWRFTGIDCTGHRASAPRWRVWTIATTRIAQHAALLMPHIDHPKRSLFGITAGASHVDGRVGGVYGLDRSGQCCLGYRRIYRISRRSNCRLVRIRFGMYTSASNAGARIDAIRRRCGALFSARRRRADLDRLSSEAHRMAVGK
jgi:hypothetical protein